VKIFGKIKDTEYIIHRGQLQKSQTFQKFYMWLDNLSNNG